MTISANRVQYIWSPLLGWALLTCSASLALAQVGVALPGVTIGPAVPSSDSTPDAGGSTSSGAPNGTTSGATPDSTISTPTATPVQSIPLPPGTTVQNPSTQLIPGLSDTFGGAGVIGGNGVSVGSGGAPGGDELGITMGSFRLYPSFDITTGYDSNVFAQSASAGPLTASLSTVVAPSLALRSEWLNHSINFLMGGGFGFYQSAPTQNYQNYFMIVDGRIDIREDWTLVYSGGYRRATEALGTPNVAFAQAPTVAESIPLSLSTTKKFNRLTFEAGGSATKFRYTDFSTITSAGLDGASRNRTGYEEHFTLGYDVTDDLMLNFGPSINQQRYDETVDSLGQNRNSDGIGVNGGATWKFGPTSLLNGSLGYTTTSSQGGLGTTSAFTFGLGGSWSGIPFLTLRPSISRSIQETALAAYRNTTATTFGLDFSYEIEPEWKMVGGLSYSLADYNPIDGLGATPRTDSFGRGSLGFMYSLRPQIAIGPLFEYTQGSSTDPVNGPSYNRQIISIRLTAKR